MNKVLQAAGRVIRTDEDRGVILLLDDRFLTGGIRRLSKRVGKPKKLQPWKYGRADRRVLEKRKGRSTDRPEKRIKLIHCFSCVRRSVILQIPICLVYVVNNAVVV